MDDYIIKGETLTAIADAIRGKTGGADGLDPVDMPDEINSIKTGGSNIDAIIDRSITEIESNVTSIGECAFRACSSLTTINFPLATIVRTNAFYECKKLTTADFPLATSIGMYAFYNCSALTTADFPLATSIEKEGFNNCKSLKTINFPMVTSIGDKGFSECKKLTTADFPLATSIGTYAFYDCSALTTADFPLVTSIGSYTFKSCSALTTADFPMVTRINMEAFYDCSALTTLILRSETMCTLSITSAFTNTPIKSGTGYIYVPRALLSDDDATKDYRRATNWSTYANQFRALEDYTVDGTITGALDETKI